MSAKANTTNARQASKSATNMPIYQSIATELRKEIHESYQPNQVLPPQRELATRFNTTYVTVGNAIKELVREGLLTRKVGSGTFITDPSKRCQGLVSVLTSTSDPKYMAKMFAKIEQSLRSRRYRVLLYGGSCDPVEEEVAFQEIGSRNEVGGIIYSFFASRFANYIEKLQGRNIPLVAILRPIPGIDCVRVDHRMIGMLQAKHTVSTGCHQIAYIGRQHIGYGQLESEGFFAGLQDSGLDYRLNSFLLDTVEGGQDTEDEVRAQIGAAFLDMLKKNVPDAVVCYSDRYLPPIVDVLRANGLEPGRDVQLVGADDQELRDFPYVTIDENLEQIGTRAAKLLVSRMTQKYEGPPRIETVTPKLVRRQSPLGAGMSSDE